MSSRAQERRCAAQTGSALLPPLPLLPPPLLLLLLLAGCSCMDVIAPNSINALNGSTVKIPCTFTSCYKMDVTKFSMNWTYQETLNDTQEMFMTYYKKKGMVPLRSFRFAERVTFAGNLEKNDLSITLSDVQLDDVGIYNCYVRNPPDRIQGHGAIQLSVVTELPPPRDSTIAVAIGASRRRWRRRGNWRLKVWLRRKPNNHSRDTKLNQQHVDFSAPTPPLMSESPPLLQIYSNHCLTHCSLILPSLLHVTSLAHSSLCRLGRHALSAFAAWLLAPVQHPSVSLVCSPAPPILPMSPPLGFAGQPASLAVAAGAVELFDTTVLRLYRSASRLLSAFCLTLCFAG
ncbi:hypothetical protein Q5P01_010051 [Channa striata]|uniref:Ig-like domain-containing protein n=1 Tax=Channa striata TaxID=64152 RepID=A0AA88MXY8_CHASR|nr:hypothetical protein Q5P01_010051 [Channa striata]